MHHRIVIAPDSFKGTLSAQDAALAIAAGWRAERPHDELLLVPQADGGEGTLDTIAQAVPEAQWRTALVSGPLVAHVSPDERGTTRHGTTRRSANVHQARWLMLPHHHAVIELAECCGLTLLPLGADDHPTFAPLTASSRGVGEAIAAALDAGARQITLALGGSASTDAGLGALNALGLRTLDATGLELEPGGGALEHLRAIDASSLRAAPPLGMRLLTDTTAVLCGPNGAARVFAPQKGATAKQVTLLDRGLARAAELAGGDAHLTPGSGAAGGTAWGFARYWGARIRSGAEAVAELTGLDEALDGADLVITGEGRFDETSRAGKVVGALAERAAAVGTPVAVIAGQVDAAAGDSAFDAALLSLSVLACSTDAAQQRPEHWLTEAGAALARTTQFRPTTTP